MPQDVDLLVDSIGELCTSASDAGLLKGAELGQIRRIKNAAIAARDGIIVAVGESAEVAAQVRVTDKTVRLDAQGRLVTPGLVDPHTEWIVGGNRCNEV
ncbi:MAG: hypothetical protein JSS86_14055 [Cyanobacteria bacterium SZAS LIN-2]|nr:hypothetical protein [Cyanobacteria bacterium SZAS LIN-2]